MTPRLPRRVLAVAALMVVAAGLVLGAPTPAAEASACSSSTGVTVIVDFNDLGGGVPSLCVAGGGGDHASDLFQQAGFPLTYAQRQPGFVCRVRGVPTQDPCVNTAPADRYWGLWWSDGDPGSGWTYSTLGAASLSIPDGGLVAFSWDDQPGDDRPSAASARPAPPAPPSTSSTPTSAPSSHPTHGTSHAPQPGSGATSTPTSGATPGAGASPSGTATSTTSPSTPPSLREGRRHRPRHDEPTAAPTSRTTPGPTSDATSTGGVEPGDPAYQAADDGSDGGGGLPGWVAPAVVVLLFAGTAVTLAVRRRSSR